MNGLMSFAPSHMPRMPWRSRPQSFSPHRSHALGPQSRRAASMSRPLISANCKRPNPASPAPASYSTPRILDSLGTRSTCSIYPFRYPSSCVSLTLLWCPSPRSELPPCRLPRLPRLPRLRRRRLFPLRARGETASELAKSFQPTARSEPGGGFLLLSPLQRRSSGCNRTGKPGAQAMSLKNAQEDSAAERSPAASHHRVPSVSGVSMLNSNGVVFKFGGSSLLAAARMLPAAGLVRDATQSSNVAVVVSAMKGVTDHLLSIARALADGKLAHARREAELL